MRFYLWICKVLSLKLLSLNFPIFSFYVNVFQSYGKVYKNTTKKNSSRHFFFSSGKFWWFFTKVFAFKFRTLLKLPFDTSYPSPLFHFPNQHVTVFLLFTFLCLLWLFVFFIFHIFSCMFFYIFICFGWRKENKIISLLDLSLELSLIDFMLSLVTTDWLCQVCLLFRFSSQLTN